MAFLQMKHWAQNLGAYLFLGSPPIVSEHRNGSLLNWAHSSSASSTTRPPVPSRKLPATLPQVEILNGYLCATTVDSQPRRLAWLLKVHLAIDLEVTAPLVLRMKETQVNLQAASLPQSAVLPSIYLQPPRKIYVPNASTRVQSLSPLIEGTDSELVIHGSGEFFLHASGGTSYFTGNPISVVNISIQLPLLAKQVPILAAPFSPALNATAGVHMWLLEPDRDTGLGIRD